MFSCANEFGGGEAANGGLVKVELHTGKTFLETLGDNFGPSLRGDGLSVKHPPDGFWIGLRG